jgi:mRNA-degrading endonuclease RelE of RelBE toxin-antitoxin system
MSWTCELAESAKQDIRNLPRAIQKRVARVMQAMERDPFQGDVKALADPQWEGIFRRRIGSYRLLFTVDQAQRRISVIRILLRSGKTYR